MLPPTSTLFPYTTLFRSLFASIIDTLNDRDGWDVHVDFDRHAIAEKQSMIIPNDRRYYLRRSEEHTSELQSRGHLVCRLLLGQKNSILSNTSSCREQTTA